MSQRVQSTTSSKQKPINPIIFPSDLISMISLSLPIKEAALLAARESNLNRAAQTSAYPKIIMAVFPFLISFRLILSGQVDPA